MMKPRTIPPPVTATTTATRIDEHALRPAGLVLPGGSAKLQMNMRIRTKLRIALAGTALSCSALLSAQDHMPKAPHGGIVGDAGTHYIEMVVAWKEAHFFLLDTLGNTLPVEGLNGTAYVKYDDNTYGNHVLTPHKKGYLIATLSKPNDFAVVVSVKLPSGFLTVQLSSGPLNGPQPVQQQHNASDGHRH